MTTQINFIYEESNEWQSEIQMKKVSISSDILRD